MTGFRHFSEKLRYTKNVAVLVEDFLIIDRPELKFVDTNNNVTIVTNTFTYYRFGL